MDIQGISVLLHGAHRKLFNLYIPPQSSCPPNFSPNLSSVFGYGGDTIVVGDLNANALAWNSQGTANTHGDVITQAINRSDLAVLNDVTQTRLPKAANQPPSSPDVSLFSTHLTTAVTWATHVCLQSNHLPISITFNDTLPNHP